METTSLIDLAHTHLRTAAEHPSGRSSVTVYGGHEHSLRQTLIALLAGQSLADHASPGEATLQVLVGAARLATETDSIDCATGDHVVIPGGRHGLEALQDCVVLLTVATARA